MRWVGGWVKQAELAREGRGKCLRMKKGREKTEEEGEGGREQEKAAGETGFAAVNTRDAMEITF